MKKIGILGGTFDPIHLAHLSIARCARQQKRLDTVLFMPAKNPPHKSRNQVSDENMRAHLVKLAIENEPYFSFSDLELQQEGFSYTARTLRLLKIKYPQDKLYFILGSDSLFLFDSWYHPEQIVRAADILVFPRGDKGREKTKGKAKELSQRFAGTFEVLDMEDIPISSAQIRKMISCGQSVKDCLPQSVYEEIVKKKYYPKQGE